ncbi:MAG: ExeM/NucH family extracellular endonuclease [Pseudomonadota bacterium]
MEGPPEPHPRNGPVYRFRGALVPVLALLLLAPVLPAGADCPAADARRTLAELRTGSVPEGQPVTVEGVVTGVFLDADALGGFYLQQDTTPPVGLFIYAPALDPVTVGHRMQVTGRFSRYRGRPQLSRIQAVHDCGKTGLPDPVTLRLPDDAQRLSDLHDVRVRFAQPLAVSGNHELGRYGSLALSADGRLIHPGQTTDTPPVDAADRQIVLDDGSYRAEPDPIPYLDARGTRRAGSRIEDLTGILAHAFGTRRLHPTEPPRWQGGERPVSPPLPGRDTLRIATASLENDFVSLGARGAADRSERQRQEHKLNALLLPLEADLLGVVEIENRPAARDRLQRRLNARLAPPRHYRGVAHPNPGSDAIKVGILYRPERLRLLDTVTDDDPVHHRPPLLARFQDRASGQQLGMVVVHFKSKGGCPDAGDIDRGQGCWNQRRTAQAERLGRWIAERKAAHNVPVIIAGDLNAYAAEAPLQRLRAAGKHDLVHSNPERAHTYVFRAQAGQLDYLLGPAAVAPQVVRGGTWAVNADEPGFLAYDGRAPGDGPWRASDHDPVWLDLRTVPEVPD